MQAPAAFAAELQKQWPSDFAAPAIVSFAPMRKQLFGSNLSWRKAEGHAIQQAQHVQY